MPQESLRNSEGVATALHQLTGRNPDFVGLHLRENGMRFPGCKNQPWAEISQRFQLNAAVPDFVRGNFFRLNALQVV